MKITQGLIREGQNGGWTREQFYLIGVSWPPPKGWKYRVIGNEISNADAAKFVALRNSKIREKYAPNEPALFPQPIPTEYQDRLNDFPETPKHPNSRAEMMERQRLRRDGLLNAPIRGTRGLARVAKEMREAGFNPRQDRLRLK